MKIDPFVDVMGFKKYDGFEDMQELLHAVYQFGFKKGYDTNTQGELLENDLKNAYELGCSQCDKNSNCSGCTDDEEEVPVSDYDIGYSDGYSDGYIHGREKPIVTELEEDWCECREIGFQEGVDTGYINGYKDALRGNAAWITDAELDKLIKTTKR